ncbi:MAG: 30S ribosomal protein S7 [Patescibacteria group bacterium]
MRGKNKTPKRKIKPDIKYNNLQVSKFINYIMKRGKKSIAQTIIYDCFDIIAEKTKQDPLEVFNNAIKNISPQLEIRSKRVGGANYQVPVPVKGDRKFALACRWIIAAVKDKKGKKMAEKLAEELVAASNNEGTSIKKKEDVQRMAEANRAFAHFAR